MPFDKVSLSSSDEEHNDDDYLQSTSMPKPSMLSRFQHRTLIIGMIVVAVVSLCYVVLLSHTSKAGVPLKGATDPAMYKVIKLSNGLKVLLASDPDTETSSAAMNVEVGSDADPIDRQGLAHFCEHMLFLGSEKYPKEDEMMEFTSRNGGYTNAFTADTNTNYVFTCQNDALSEGLDRFAQMFISPIFLQDGVEREVNAVNNEHSKNLQSDNWRLFQLWKELSNPESSWHRFNTGNTETLNKPDILQRLKDFHEAYYRSASQMQLAVIGNASLHDLQNMVETFFAGVPSKESGPHFLTPNVPLFSKTGFKVYMNSVKDSKEMVFFWLLPDLSTPQYYRHQTSSFVVYLLTGTSKGSLGTYLKEKGWATSVSADPDSVYGIGTLLTISVEMTAEGMNHHQDDIAEAVFAYVSLAREQGLTCTNWNALQDLKKLNFKYHTKDRPDGFVQSASQNLMTMDIEDVLGSPERATCNEKVMQEIFEILTPSNVMIYVVARGRDSTFDKTEPIYGTKYNVTDISESLKNKWASMEPHPSMMLPPPNEFVPKDLRLLHKQPKELPVPELAKGESPSTKVWVAPSKVAALKPVQILYCKAQMPKPAKSNATLIEGLGLFEHLVKDSLEEVAQMAAQSGLSFDVSASPSGASFSFSGYTDTLPLLQDQVISAFKNPSGLQKRFKDIKEEKQLDIANLMYMNLYLYVFRVIRPTVIMAVSTTPTERLEALKPLTYDDVKDIWYSHMAQEMHLECAAFGNVNATRGQAMSNEFTKLVPHPTLPVEKLTDATHHEFQVGKAIIQLDNPNPKDKNSAYLSTYQMLHTNSIPRKDALTIELIEHLISNEVFSVLRTAQQLGYVVTSRVETVRHLSYTISYFNILIQSSDFDAHVLDERASDFMDSQKKYLETNVTDAEFQTAKDGLYLNLWPVATSIGHEFSHYLTEMSGHTYQWDLDKQDRETLASITRQDCLDMYTKMFTDPLTVRKVSLLVYVNGSKKKSPAGNAKPTSKHSSVESWAKTVGVIKGTK